jgi:MFS family permease
MAALPESVPPPSPGKAAVPIAAGAGAGALTMVALCFANGLQGGAGQTFAQSTEALKHTFHINDAALGVVPFCTGIAGNVGAVPVAAICARHKRTTVLAVMFVLWGVVVALAGLVPAFAFLGLAAAGFVLFGALRVISSLLEATDPASLPLIGDWWPVEARARKVSIFNAGAAVGSFAGLGGAGVIVDNFGWRWAFVAWLPIALVGAALIHSRVEPRRGAQDAAYGDRLEAATEGTEHDLVVELVEHEAPAVAAEIADEVVPGDRWAIVRAVARLRSWRRAAVGVAVTGMMGNGLGTWGLAYFKRTFHLSGTRAAGLAPLLGAGAFLGVLGGGFLADRLLRRGLLRARVYVTALGYSGAGLVYLLAFTTTRLAVAAPLLALASTLAALPTGPQFALLMDVTPSPLRSQASAAANVLQATGAFGAVLVGGLSTLFGENLRLALLCVSPFYVIGGMLVLSASQTYVQDVALVVAEAKGRDG